MFSFLEFGSWTMLWWLGAGSAPILIHLLSKRRYRIMDWAAMRYLQNALRRKARRIRLEQWLLLLVRTLLILLMVLALAQPFTQEMFVTGPIGKRTERSCGGIALRNCDSSSPASTLESLSESP